MRGTLRRREALRAPLAAARGTGGRGGAGPAQHSRPVSAHKCRHAACELHCNARPALGSRSSRLAGGIAGVSHTAAWCTSGSLNSALPATGTRSTCDRRERLWALAALCSISCTYHWPAYRWFGRRHSVRARGAGKGKASPAQHRVHATGCCQACTSDFLLLFLCVLGMSSVPQGVRCGVGKVTRRVLEAVTLSERPDTLPARHVSCLLDGRARRRGEGGREERVWHVFLVDTPLGPAQIEPARK